MAWIIAQCAYAQKRLKRLARRGGRSKEDAEDLIQEALLRLHEYCRSGDVRDEQAFLERTVRNLAIDWYRRDRRHPMAQDSVEELDAITPFVDAGMAPDDIFAAQQRLYKIRTALDAVSPRMRVVYFAHRSGFSYADIGVALNISKSTIEKDIARAVMVLMDVKESQ